MSDTPSPCSSDVAERVAGDVIDVEATSSTQSATVAPTPVQSPPASVPTILPPEAHVLLEMIGRGLAPDADDAVRATARELWGRCAHAIFGAATQAPATPAAAIVASAAAVLPTTGVPTLPLPTSPIAMAAHAIKRMTPDQLLDTLLQRLRAALPAGTTIAAPRGIQFQLIPVTPPAKDPR